MKGRIGMVAVDVDLSLVKAGHPLDNVSTEQVGDIVTKKEIQLAYNEEKDLQRNKGEFVAVTFKIAKNLYNIYENRWYKLLGFNTFEDWLKSPEVDIDVRSGYRYAQLYRVYIESKAFTIQELAEAGVSKLELLIPYVTPTAHNWKERREQIMEWLALPRIELIELLNEKRSGGQEQLRGAPDHNGKDAMKVDAKFSEVKEGDEAFADATKDEKGSKETSNGKPSGETSKTKPADPISKLGIVGWYELVPQAEAPTVKGKTVTGVYLTAAKVVLSGNRVFIDVE
jgi:hypothetical protein